MTVPGGSATMRGDFARVTAMTAVATALLQ